LKVVLDWNGSKHFLFSGSGLKSIVIPGGVTSIDGSAFAVLSLNSISVSANNKRFRVRECFLEDCDGSTIYRYFGSSRSIVIPSSVLVLEKGSFYECKSLESVTFETGSRLERIEESAFSRSGLKSITIPSSVIVSGKESFRECKSLKSVTFESGYRLERIEESAFSRSGLKSILIPSSVIVLGKESFFRCRSLESVTFESDCRLERIDKSMFDGSRVSFGLASHEVAGIKRKRENSSLQGTDGTSSQAWSAVADGTLRGRPAQMVSLFAYLRVPHSVQDHSGGW
jgi:hypothetical protein